MALTLEQYAEQLAARADLNWPEPPDIDPPKAKPFLKSLPGIRAVTWNVYGTLLVIPSGELYFTHPQKFIMDVALDKTIQEFKMWKAMTRKPGAPSEYMRVIYQNVMADLKLKPAPTGEKHGAIAAEHIWEAIVKKLATNEYTFNLSVYGSIDVYSQKIAYFFHASLQGTGPYPGAAQTLQAIKDRRLWQGILADGQCFTPVQLQRGLRKQEPEFDLNDVIPHSHRVWSAEMRGKKPSERLFRKTLELVAEEEIEPHEVLHVGSSLERDIIPARKLGMKTALFAGDKNSLQATPEQLKDKQIRPDIMITELSQVLEVLD
jgi:FMN phosphatase YigB (HAD superfamily)